MVGERPPPDSLQAGWWYPYIWVYGPAGGPDNFIFFGIAPIDTFEACDYSIAFGPGRTDNPCDRNHLWSLHPGGANFLFADGSAKYLSYAIGNPTAYALLSRDSGEVVDLP